MVLLLDEHVPTSVADVFRGRGHVVHLAQELVGAGSPDQIVAATGDRLGPGTVLVTWDKDYQALVPRASKAGAGRFRNLSRISFACPEPQAAVRLTQEIETIEFRHGLAMTLPDKRIIVEITSERLTFR